jgi:hypothetical protein
MHSAAEDVETDDLLLAVYGLDKKEVRAVYRRRLSGDALRELLGRLDHESLSRLKEKIPSDPGTQATNAVAKFMVGLANGYSDPWVYTTMLDSLIHIASNVARIRYVDAFLEGVLKKSTATAWVCSEDIVALNAVKFLRGRGKKVPEEISVIGFENYRESHEQQLSTLDFNMNGMVQQALTMIMDEKSLKSKPAITEVDGYVVERRTTRK